MKLVRAVEQRGLINMKNNIVFPGIAGFLIGLLASYIAPTIMLALGMIGFYFIGYVVGSIISYKIFVSDLRS